MWKLWRYLSAHEDDATTLGAAGMSQSERKYDLVLYGASGFTGRQTVEYCKRAAPPGLRWAIAGRNRAKLDSVNSAGVDVLIADSKDVAALDTLAASTRVVATTAGPFSLYGTQLVDACVRHQTHYCDITGETPWIRGLIDRYHVRAAAQGTRIVPTCGFDSIPSDFGAWLTAKHIREVLHSECVSMSAYFKLGGGINGGTLASFYHLIETGQITSVRDAYLLNPDRAAPTTEQRSRNADPSGVRFDPDARRWVTSFVMGSINTRVVRRTQALLGTQFDYQEYSAFKKPSSARIAAIGGRIFETILGSGIGRLLLKPVLPRPGDGPSEKVMDGGFFETTFIAHAQNGAVVQGVLQGQGDPGNRITVKCLCESAFVLASTEDPSRRPAAGAGGVLTPVTALGESLVPRLAAAGISFKITQN
jgi:short subunit dehydrogenase-like uncharacterized protein